MDINDRMANLIIPLKQWEVHLDQLLQLYGYSKIDQVAAKLTN